MNRIKKMLILFIITSVFIIINCGCVLADPNSSKGFAEYDDTKAEQESEKITEEQENKYNGDKSTNNYLESLEVEGYELLPNFDKQILEYTIDKEIESKEINIKANASDSRSKIDGIGIIQLKDNQKQCKIEVTSESGTVRTYTIEIKRSENLQENEDNKSQNDELNNVIIKDTVEENENAIVEKYSQQQDSNVNKDNKNIFVAIGIAVLLIIIFVIIIKIKTKRENGKHRK